MWTLSAFERRMAPFIAVQAALGAFGGFAAVFVMADAGAAAVARYAALMLALAGVATVGSLAIGGVLAARGWSPSAGTWVRLGFLLPALVLPWATHAPALLALGYGGFLGLTWGMRHWLELQVLGDEERDGYAAHAIALAVGMGLVTVMVVSGLLSVTGDRHEPVLALFAGLGLLGAWIVPARLPEAPPPRLQAPAQVLRQRGFLASLPLFLLESGLFGVGLVLGASGAVRALGAASSYGWAVSAATLAGALALVAARRHRHHANRDGWMRSACAGMVLAAALLGGSAIWPALFVLHLLVQYAVQPFWQASEHVLNQRALDLQGAVGDRIAAREGALAVLRVATLGVFWALAAGLDDRQRLIAGAALVAAAAACEYLVGRAWLVRRVDAPAAAR